MKALTLWQPWASFAILGLMRFETRSWGTDYRGVLAIHAAHSEPAGVRERWLLERELRALLVREMRQYVKFFPKGRDPVAVVYDALPRGVVLGTVQLTSVVKADTRRVKPPESLLGDFSKGRWAWCLRLPQPFAKGIPANGRRRLWEWSVSGG